MLHRFGLFPRALLLGASCALVAACNLILGLPEGIQRIDGGGGSGGAPSGGGGADSSGGGGEGATTTDGGGGSGANGGSGGGGSDTGGGGSCPAEETPPAGTLLTENGSFEDGTLGWVPFGVPAPSVEPGGFCYCSYGELTLPGTYGELRYGVTLTVPAGTQFHVRARVRAPDSVAVDVQLREGGGGTQLIPAVQFEDDASDLVEDGWRFVEHTWETTGEFVDPLLAVAFDGSGGQVVGIDCVTLTYEEP